MARIGQLHQVADQGHGHKGHNEHHRPVCPSEDCRICHDVVVEGLQDAERCFGRWEERHFGGVTRITGRAGFEVSSGDV